MVKKALLLILTVALVFLAGCASSPKGLEGAERDAILAYSEPMADNELAALNANDYDAFIKDYDVKMRGSDHPGEVSPTSLPLSPPGLANTCRGK